MLTPEEAVMIALKNNYDIIIAKNDAQIAKINDNKAAAGMYPKINISTSDVLNIYNINQKFTTGQEVKKNWVPINAFNIGAMLNWTVFDGYKMFATKDRLAALASLGELQVKNQLQNTVAQVLNAYYEIVRQKQYLRATTELSNISLERVILSQKKYDVGYSDKTPLLQAKMDYNTQQINIIKQETQLKQAKVALNQILGSNTEDDYDVIDSIAVDYKPELPALKEQSLSANYGILTAQKNIEIAKLQHKEIYAQKLPLINLTSGYVYAQNNSKAGLQLFNRSYGPTIGFNASVPIFDAGLSKKQLQASSVNIINKANFLEQTKQKINANLLTAFNNFENAQKVMKLNEENVQVAQENVQISLERYRLNQATSLEMKQAQSSYEDALYSVILAKFNAKIAEIDLKRISNGLEGL
ncbi:MAG: TolC family protein [Chitinophagaceae bacterium]|nr:TolC family protein [Chitinophagaceae bacterium]